MHLSAIKKTDILGAIREFDRLGREKFLEEYEFGKTLKYVLLHEGREYDFKAIYGVAHGYAVDDFLTKTTFKGNVTHAVGYAEKLGFRVVDKSNSQATRIARNPKWTREEIILALDVYMRCGLIGERDPEAIELSKILRSRADLSSVSNPEKYRNINGVKLKLANISRLDPGYSGKGMRGGGGLESEIWEEFAGDPDRLSEVAHDLRTGRSSETHQDSVNERDRTVSIRPVEQIHTPEFNVFTAGIQCTSERREQKVVHAFADFLKDRGHKVGTHHYGKGSTAMRCDLFDETEQVLYEAKGTAHRFQIRLAIGQLLDYRRFEAGTPKLAILVPSRPNDDIIDLCNGLDISVTWMNGDSFETIGVLAL